MFRISFMVEDTKLGPVKALLAGTGYVHDLTDQHVVNATVQKGEVVASSGGTTVELFFQWLAGLQGSFTVGDVREWLPRIGRQSTPSVAAKCIAAAKEAQLIRVHGSKRSRTFTVIRKK